MPNSRFSSSKIASSAVCNTSTSDGNQNSKPFNCKCTAILFVGFSMAAAAAAAAAASATSSLAGLPTEAWAGLVGVKRENGELVLKLEGLRGFKKDAAKLLVAVRALLKPRTRPAKDSMEVRVQTPPRPEVVVCTGGGVALRRRCKKREVKILTATIFSSSESKAMLQFVGSEKSALVQHKPQGKTSEEKCR